MTKTRNRKPFNKVVYKVFAVYNDNTEEFIKQFRYSKAAERYTNKYAIDNGRFVIREVHADVL